MSGVDSPAGRPHRTGRATSRVARDLYQPSPLAPRIPVELRHAVQQLGSQVLCFHGLPGLQLTLHLLRLPDAVWQAVHLLRLGQQVPSSPPLLSDRWYHLTDDVWSLVEETRQCFNPPHFASELDTFVSQQVADVGDTSPVPNPSLSQLETPIGSNRTVHGSRQQPSQSYAATTVGVQVPSQQPSPSDFDVGVSHPGGLVESVASSPVQPRPPLPPPPPPVDGTRSAGQGKIFKCPSKGCTREFQKRGHYENHLTKQHPDFRTAHPNHDHRAISSDLVEPPPSRQRHEVSISSQQRRQRRQERQERQERQAQQEQQERYPHYTEEMTVLPTNLPLPLSMNANAPWPDDSNAYPATAPFSEYGDSNIDPSYPPAHMLDHISDPWPQDIQQAPRQAPNMPYPYDDPSYTM